MRYRRSDTCGGTFFFTVNLADRQADYLVRYIDALRQVFWQRRYWEHQIRDEADLQAHVDYIHFNPVKHGYAQIAADWPYSTIHREIARGTMPVNWAVGSDLRGAFGE